MKFFLLFMVTLCILPLSVQAQDVRDWSKINTFGLYNTFEEGQINANIWRGYTLDKAVHTVSLMPRTLRSPAYRSVARKFLLSNAPPVQNGKKSPDLLAIRLQKLIEYGFFGEAKQLYDNATQDIPADYNLALTGIQMILADGDLAPACLDIQASSAIFGDIPAWQELFAYCRKRFGNDSRDNEFRVYPLLGHLSTSAPISLSLLDSATETLIAFADKKITAQFYNTSARNMEQVSDLFVSLALDSAFKKNETYSCYAIEAARRGIKDIHYLSELYRIQPFNPEDLQGRNGAVSMHPCAVPAFFYQRLNQKGRSENELAVDVNLLLDVTNNLSPYAMTPMADIIASHYIPDMPDMKDWRAGLILTAAGKTIPESWVNPIHNNMPTMVVPLGYMQKENQINTGVYQKWIQILSSLPEFANLPIDYGLPFYYLQNLTGQVNGLENKPIDVDYEKFFSLTYSKKYLHSSLGTIGAMALAKKAKDIPKQIIIALAAVGKADPSSVDPVLIAGVLTTFKGLKLEKEKQVLAFDALH